MARPNKEGLDYFPLDVHIFEDEKIEAIAGEFGIKGELVVIKLLCAVYEKGYFVVWNDLMKSKLLKRVPGTSKELLEQIVARLVAWEFFHEDLFNSAKVLTSANIQATYFEATKRRKSPKPTKYVINVDINSQINGINADINPQSKVNKSKVNKSKVNDINNDRQKVFEAYSQQIKPMDRPEQIDRVQSFVEEEFPLDVVLFAIDYAANQKKKSANYIVGVLNGWKKSGVKTVGDAQMAVKNFTQSHSSYQKPVRKEKLPDWSNDDYDWEEEERKKKEESLKRLEEMGFFNDGLQQTSNDVDVPF